MKNKLLLSALIFATFFAFTAAYAQAPEFINYQAVARNSAGAVLQNQQITVRLTIHNNTPNGAFAYLETDTVLTNEFGLFTIAIGKGTTIPGGFRGIAWSGGAKYLQVELDPAAGSNFTDMGTSQLLSVPYALHAKTSEDNTWLSNGNDIYNSNTGKVGIGTATPAASAAVDISSTTGALLLPRLTDAQRDALTPVAGMTIYNTTRDKFQGYTSKNGTLQVEGPSVTIISPTSSFGSCNMIEQSFIAENNAPLDKISVYAFANGGPNPIRYRLHTGYGVSTVVLDSLDVTVPNTAGWIDLIFPAHPQLIAGETYHLRINADQSTNHCTWIYTTDIDYPAGVLLESTQPPGGWNVYSANDLIFKVYQNVNTTGPSWVDLH